MVRLITQPSDPDVKLFIHFPPDVLVWAPDGILAGGEITVVSVCCGGGTCTVH